MSVRCPKLAQDCGAAWTCPQCDAVMHHVQFCTACGLGYCGLCLGAGTILDDSYVLASPRTVRCPECSCEAA